ncbi:MAG: hypothetical protein AMXMBFR53_35360 [Gemmatimonadota bacterium]
MNHEAGLDWDRLSQVWAGERVADELVGKLKAKIRTRTLVMRATSVGEVLVLAALALISRWYLGPEPSTLQVALIATIWAWAVGLFSFAWWNRRESWRADTAGIEGYLALLERRARASLRTAGAVGPLAVVEGVVVLGLVRASPPRPGGLDLAWGLAIALVVGIVAGIGAWAWWYARAARRELAELAATRSVLSGDQR